MPDRPSEIATLFPGAFAFVMATGIIAIGAEQQDIHWLALVLYALAAAGYVVLAVALTARLVRYWRRFVADVDFLTSPGWLKGGRTRAESGLRQGGMWRVVTDLAVMGFDEATREMKVLAFQQGVTREEVQDYRENRDPILHAERDLEAMGVKEEELKAIDKEIKDIVVGAAKFAEEAPEPDAAELTTDVLVGSY